MILEPHHTFTYLKEHDKKWHLIYAQKKLFNYWYTIHDYIYQILYKYGHIC